MELIVDMVLAIIIETVISLLDVMMLALALFSLLLAGFQYEGHALSRGATAGKAFLTYRANGFLSLIQLFNSSL